MTEHLVGAPFFPDLGHRGPSETTGDPRPKPTGSPQASTAQRRGRILACKWSVLTNTCPPCIMGVGSWRSRRTVWSLRFMPPHPDRDTSVNTFTYNVTRPSGVPTMSCSHEPQCSHHSHRCHCCALTFVIQRKIPGGYESQAQHPNTLEDGSCSSSS